VKLAYMPSCIRPEVRLTPYQRILCGDCWETNVLWLAQVVSHFVLHRSKIPLVLATKVTRLRRLLFRLQNGVNSVVRRVHLAITAKLDPTEMLRQRKHPWSIFVNIFILYEIKNSINLNTAHAPGD